MRTIQLNKILEDKDIVVYYYKKENCAIEYSKHYKYISYQGTVFSKDEEDQIISQLSLLKEYSSDLNLKIGINTTNIANAIDVEVKNTDIGDTTVKDYLKVLLLTVWEKKECFSGKRPWGNSGWAYDLYAPLIAEGFISGTLDEDDCVEELDTKEADLFIAKLIDNHLFK